MPAGFNLTGLHNAYNEDIHSVDITFAFEIYMPPGRFILFMFFSQDH